MTRLENFIEYLFTRQRWVIHFFYWLFILAFYVVFFGRKNSNYLQTFFFVGLLMPVTIAATYFLNYFLVPRYLMRERYGLFALYFVYTIVASIFFEMMISLITFIVMAGVNMKNMSPSSIDIFFLMTSLLMVVFLGMVIKMVLHWRKSKEDYQLLMKEKVEAELRFLKTQLNPHFLFNTLNNLYFLTTEKSEKAPAAILALSEILDYVLHSGKTMLVPIEAEWKQVQNYIALELLRYEDRVQITTHFSNEEPDCTIGPMILITLIENAFKHGVMPVAGKSWIRMNIDCKDSKINISIVNSWQNKISGNGIGLENMKSQLGLLFKESYSLIVDSSKTNEFHVNLVLNIKK
ncbi:MAG TPA: histidine kinase [Chryseolinea sp.]|nr:histidine kinase [Chryseolinea sp.]